MSDGIEFLRSIISVCRNAVGPDTFSEELALQVEEQLLRDYGGSNPPYLPKVDRDARRDAVLRDFNGRNRAEVCRKHGIGKAQFYRYLKGD